MKWHYGVAGVSLVIGLLYGAISLELLVIRPPADVFIDPVVATNKSTKKVIVHYWQNGSWHTETDTILWQEDKSAQLTALINSWLAVLAEERVIDKKINLQTVIGASSGNEFFVSFDCYPFFKDSSTYEKYQWIEGLLKTIRANGVAVQSIRFLVQHQELVDAHLDFSRSWPVAGFLQ